MPSLIPDWLGAHLFVPILVLDYLLVGSFLFLCIYPAGIFLASFIPRKWNASPNSACLPCLFLISIALPLTAFGSYCAAALGHYLRFALAELPGTLLISDNYLLSFGFVAVWLAGLGAGWLGIVRRLAALRRLDRQVGSVQDPAFALALRRSGLGRRVRLMETPGVAAPASWRLIRAVVYVPPGFTKRGRPEERSAVYAHELSHIRRWDSLKLLVLALLQAVFWFNPLFHSAAGRYRNHLEIACDRAALKNCRLDRLAYAGLLLALSGRQSSPVQGFSGAYRDAARRLGYIFNDRRLLPPGRDRALALGCLLATFVLVAAYREIPPRTHPWGEIATVTHPAGELEKFKVYFNWNGMLGSYIIAD